MQGSEFHQYFDQFPFLKKHFVGVFSIDTLPKSLKYRHFCICNTDNSNGSGEHWFCFLRSGKSEIECFDSLGINTLKRDILENSCRFRGIKELTFNETQVQDNNSSTCGYFSIYFLIERMHNLDLLFEDFLDDIFVEDLSKNEEIVQKFCRNIINHL